MLAPSEDNPKTVRVEVVGAGGHLSNLHPPFSGEFRDAFPLICGVYDARMLHSDAQDEASKEDLVKAITLRNLPAEVARKIRQRADKEGISLNRAVIETLEESLGISGKKTKPLHHDLDFLIGTWSKEEAVEFERALADQRRIDPEIWK